MPRTDEQPISPRTTPRGRLYGAGRRPVKHRRMGYAGTTLAQPDRDQRTIRLKSRPDRISEREAVRSGRLFCCDGSPPLRRPRMVERCARRAGRLQQYRGKPYDPFDCTTQYPRADPSVSEGRHLPDVVGRSADLPADLRQPGALRQQRDEVLRYPPHQPLTRLRAERFHGPVASGCMGASGNCPAPSAP
jgi:hypothetical protein